MTFRSHSAPLCRTVLASGLLLLPVTAAEDVTIADFEGQDFGKWKVTGEAFGTGPLHDPIPGQMPVDGYQGTGYCSSFHGEDKATGTLVSEPFRITRRYLNFLIGGGGFAGETCINLRLDGKIVRTATGPNTRPGGSERLYSHGWDVGDLAGKEVTLELVDKATGGWGHVSVDQIVLSDTAPISPQANLLKEANAVVASKAQQAASDPLRPVYHVMPEAQSSGDPNGPVFFNGEYHLFFQHFPFWGTNRDGIFWGHAVSKDMVHWEHLPIAMAPGPESWDITGVASGCCVVHEGTPTIVYTGFSAQGNSQVQSIATSSDGLRTWNKDPADPVVPKLPEIKGLSSDLFRDPFVWREGTEWRMLVGAGFANRGGTVLLYSSRDLRTWKSLGPLCEGKTGDTGYMWECPTFFPLGDRQVLIVSPLFHEIPGLRGDTRYAVGKYHDNHFEPEAWHAIDLGGPRAYYAATSFEDQKKRRILWGMVMTPQGPASGWSNCISLPRVLTLAADGTLRYAPLPELEALRSKARKSAAKQALKDGQEVVLDTTVGLHAESNLEIDVKQAKKIELRIGRTADGSASVPFAYDQAAGTLTLGQRTVPFQLKKGEPLRFRLFTDGVVAEAYVNERECFSQAIPVTDKSVGLSIVAAGGDAELKACEIWEMSSIW